MLWIENKNVVRILKLKILDESCKKILHPLNVNLPKNFFILPRGKKERKRKRINGELGATINQQIMIYNMNFVKQRIFNRAPEFH